MVIRLSVLVYVLMLISCNKLMQKQQYDRNISIVNGTFHGTYLQVGREQWRLGVVDDPTPTTRFLQDHCRYKFKEIECHEERGATIVVEQAEVSTPRGDLFYVRPAYLVALNGDENNGAYPTLIYNDVKLELGAKIPMNKLSGFIVRRENRTRGGKSKRLYLVSVPPYTTTGPNAGDRPTQAIAAIVICDQSEIVQAYAVYFEAAMKRRATTDVRALGHPSLTANTDLLLLYEVLLDSKA